MPIIDSPTAVALTRALDELNGAVPDDVEEMTDESALQALTEMHERLGIDFAAVVEGAHEAARAAVTVYTPKDFLLEPVETIAGLWQAGFLAGARTQQLLVEVGE